MVGVAAAGDPAAASREHPVDASQDAQAASFREAQGDVSSDAQAAASRVGPAVASLADLPGVAHAAVAALQKVLPSKTPTRAA